MICNFHNAVTLLVCCMLADTTRTCKARIIRAERVAGKSRDRNHRNSIRHPAYVQSIGDRSTKTSLFSSTPPRENNELAEYDFCRYRRFGNRPYGTRTNRLNRINKSHQTQRIARITAPRPIISYHTRSLEIPFATSRFRSVWIHRLLNVRVPHKWIRPVSPTNNVVK